MVHVNSKFVEGYKTILHLVYSNIAIILDVGCSTFVGYCLEWAITTDISLENVQFLALSTWAYSKVTGQQLFTGIEVNNRRSMYHTETMKLVYFCQYTDTDSPPLCGCDKF